MWARLEVVRSECEACRLKWVEAREGSSGTRSKQALRGQAERIRELVLVGLIGSTTHAPPGRCREASRRVPCLVATVRLDGAATACEPSCDCRRRVCYCSGIGDREDRRRKSLPAYKVGDESADTFLPQMIDFPIVFLDEAAMCTEPVSMVPLMKGCEHATLIGDHKQLPAVVQVCRGLHPRFFGTASDMLSRPLQSHAAKRERLHESLFERLVKAKCSRRVWNILILN